jgi:alkylation response protein AidB-like acyl-CoA dehydrogenase
MISALISEASQHATQQQHHQHHHHSQQHQQQQRKSVPTSAELDQMKRAALQQAQAQSYGKYIISPPSATSNLILPTIPAHLLGEIDSAAPQ